MDQSAAHISVAPPIKLLHSIPDVCHALGIKKSSVYNLVAAKRLRLVKFGKLSFVPDEDMRAFAASLPEKTLRRAA